MLDQTSKITTTGRFGRESHRASVWCGFATLALLATACWGWGNTQAKCGDGKCEGGERCEDCPADCGKCNVCGDGKCSVTEIENCNTCPKDCACPDIAVCARELTLPPRCILRLNSPCPQGGVPQAFTFCLSDPNKPNTQCFNRFETTVTACTREQAAVIAQASATNYKLQDGPCPPCH